jgi:hypothetical protein
LLSATAGENARSRFTTMAGPGDGGMISHEQNAPG